MQQVERDDGDRLGRRLSPPPPAARRPAAPPRRTSTAALPLRHRDLIPHPHRAPACTTRGADGEAPVAITVDRLEHVEVTVDPARLRAGRSSRTGRCACTTSSRTSPIVIVEPTTRPRRHRRAARWRGSGAGPSCRCVPVDTSEHACAARIVERSRRARRTRSSRRRARRRAGSRTDASPTSVAPTQRHAPTEPLGQPVIAVGHGTVGQRDLRAPSHRSARRRVEQLGHPARGQAETGVDVEEHEGAVTGDATVAISAVSSCSPWSDLTGNRQSSSTCTGRRYAPPRGGRGGAGASVRPRSALRPARPRARARARRARRRPGGRS